MADVDEDVIPRNGPDTGETDLSDETQDFRFLATVSSEDAKIPKRGEKDFEPHETALQSNTLAASRGAMHNALSFQRVHPPKRHNLAIYHPETNMAYTESPKGPLFKSMGKVYPPKDDPLGLNQANSNRLWLLPEEILYLLERGTVDVRWPVEDDDDEKEGLPMSLQGAYSAFIGMEADLYGALTFERYSVYSALKRMGYVVHRAPTWNSLGNAPGPECFPPLPGTWALGMIARRWRGFFDQSRNVAKTQSSGPLTTPQLYRSYADVYRKLSLIPWYDPTTARDPEPLDPEFKVTYHVWKPSNTTYKKSDPGVPDFRIAVVDARTTSVPTLAQLGGLFASTVYTPPDQNAQLYQRMRHGHKNVILAIVDQGVTSYLRVADSGFGRQKLYDRKSGPPRKKGGGGGKARGRGR